MTDVLSVLSLTSFTAFSAFTAFVSVEFLNPSFIKTPNAIISKSRSRSRNFILSTKYK